MSMESNVREAILAELKRQAANGRLRVEEGEEPEVTIEGQVDMDELVMAVLGALAGGP